MKVILQGGENMFVDPNKERTEEWPDEAARADAFPLNEFCVLLGWIWVERQAVGSLFTANLSPTKVVRTGGQKGESRTEIAPVFRHLLLASRWHRGHWMTLSVHKCVRVCASEWMKDRDIEGISDWLMCLCWCGRSRKSPLKSYLLLKRRKARRHRAEARSGGDLLFFKWVWQLTYSLCVYILIENTLGCLVTREIFFLSIGCSIWGDLQRLQSPFTAMVMRCIWLILQKCPFHADVFSSSAFHWHVNGLYI